MRFVAVACAHGNYSIAKEYFVFLEELPWHLRCMRRGRGEVGCGARYAVFIASLLGGVG